MGLERGGVRGGKDEKVPLLTTFSPCVLTWEALYMCTCVDAAIKPSWCQHVLYKTRFFLHPSNKDWTSFYYKPASVIVHDFA